ncbi:MAG: 23S rRNA (uracil(1939)-C(5))-methyltransferase RlmD [Desulfovibrionaceae bacterium]|nr:23S rRNA (uracil(1939)-C(5))-methyltransferase RlmD [Desulfovibrionaceae bacterium]
MDVYNLYIESLSPDGRGVARIPLNKDKPLVVFVTHALPNQTVKAQIVQRKSHFWEAECIAVENNAQSLPPICQSHFQCGGCPLQCLAYPEQLNYKHKFLLAAFRQVGLDQESIQKVLEPILPSPKLCGYRNKIEWAFALDKDNESMFLGQRQAKSATVSKPKGCMLQDHRVIKLAQIIAERASESSWLPYTLEKATSKTQAQGFWRGLILREGFIPDKEERAFFAICVTSPATKSQAHFIQKMGQHLLQDNQDLACFIHEERKSLDHNHQGQLRRVSLGQRLMELPLGGLRFRLDPAAFFQVNLGAAELIWQSIARYLPDSSATCLDLYCGVGAPGLLLAPHMHKLFGVEIDKRAIRACQNNAKRFGLNNCEYIQGKASKVQLPKANLVLCDPPRQGLEPQTLNALLKMQPRRIIYVSCNPQTLARDVKAFLTNYSITAITPIDLFPHTAHLETVSILEKI